MIVFETECSVCKKPIKRVAQNTKEIAQLQAEIYKHPVYCSSNCQYPDMWCDG